MKTRRQRKYRRRDLHFLNEEGMVACNPRDREAAHRAEIEGIATENRQAVTCKKCLNIIRKIKKIYQKSSFNRRPFGYNYYIYPKENWYLRVIPRFVHRAGFELGTGLQVNVIDPFDAAAELKGAEEKMKNVMKKLRKY